MITEDDLCPCPLCKGGLTEFLDSTVQVERHRKTISSRILHTCDIFRFGGKDEARIVITGQTREDAARIWRELAAKTIS